MIPSPNVVVVSAKKKIFTGWKVFVYRPSPGGALKIHSRSDDFTLEIHSRSDDYTLKINSR